MSKQVNSFTTGIEAIRGQDLSGKVAIVTGGNNGIGVETVRALAHAGAKVYMTSRSVEKGEKVAEEIRSKGIKGSVQVAQLDLTDLANVHKFSNMIKSNEKNLHYLICNAGIGLPNRVLTKYGFETTMGTNHFGHFALVEDLKEFMVKQNEPSRIVIVSSDGYMMGSVDFNNLNYENSTYFIGGKVYGDSKLANILHTKALAKQLADTKVKVFCLHPGGIMTGLPGNFVPKSYYEYFRQNSENVVYFMTILSRGEFKSPAQGAATSVYAAVAPEIEPYSGSYLRNCGITDVFYYAKDQQKADQFYDLSKKLIKEAELKVGA